MDKELLGLRLWRTAYANPNSRDLINSVQGNASGRLTRAGHLNSNEQGRGGNRTQGTPSSSKPANPEVMVCTAYDPWLVFVMARPIIAYQAGPCAGNSLAGGGGDRI